MRVLLIVAVLIASYPLPAQTPAEHQRSAKAALQAELAAEGKDCPSAQTTYDENICIGAVAETTSTRFNTFYGALAALLEADDRKLLDDAQAQWQIYRQKTCNAVDHLYRAGTIRASADVRCEIELTRSRMRDLDSLYASVLHL